jgi:hypothetical protein
MWRGKPPSWEIFSLSFQNYFSIEKGDVACFHFENFFLEFSELFLNGEKLRKKLKSKTQIGDACKCDRL